MAASIAAPSWIAVQALQPVGRTDGSLVRAVRAGSEEALELLIQRHWNSVVTVALAYVGDQATAEDVAQETMLVLVSKLDGFDGRRRFSPWLHRVAVNKAKDALRARGRNPVPSEAPGELARWTPPPFQDQDERLSVALELLSPEDTAIVILARTLGYRSREIAEILDMPAATVRTRLSRALKTMRTHFDGGAR